MDSEVACVAGRWPVDEPALPTSCVMCFFRVQIWNERSLSSLM